MNIVPELVTQWVAPDRVLEMAERVAGRSRLAVWQRVLHRVATLGPTEARGYLRARSVAVIREETNRLIEQEGSKIARLQEKIENAALQLFTETILAQLDQRRLQAGSRTAA